MKGAESLIMSRNVERTPFNPLKTAIYSLHDVPDGDPPRGLSQSESPPDPPPCGKNPTPRQISQDTGEVSRRHLCRICDFLSRRGPTAEPS